jgi:hypothetical protein
MPVTNDIPPPGQMHMGSNVYLKLPTDAKALPVAK